MNSFKTVVAGVVGGALVGRILGIGPVGTALGAVAGAVVGVLLSELDAGAPSLPAST